MRGLCVQQRFEVGDVRNADHAPPLEFDDSYFEGKKMLLTASYGLAKFDGDLDLKCLIKAADQALTRAQNLARKRVEFSDMRNEEELS